jgi:hypothetical protein
MKAPTDRQRFREIVAAVAEKARAILPVAVNGRIESATTLVLLGEVAPQEDGSIQVGSCTDPTKVYHLVGLACDCADYPRAPESWCKHRIAAGIQKRVQELLPQAPVEASAVAPVAAPVAPAALPEAACSVNCHVMVAGRQVQVTLRGTSEAEVLSRLEQVLQKYPVLPAGNAKNPRSASGETSDTGQPGWCQIHQVPLSSTTKNGRTWQSHKTSDGWCKGR